MTRIASILTGLLALALLSGPAFAANDEATPPGWLPLAQSVPQGSVVPTLDASTAEGLEISLSVPGAYSSRLPASDGNAYTHLRIPGCGATAGRIGLPEMPFKGFFVEVPYGVDVTVFLPELASISLGTGFTVFPLQPPPPDDGRATEQPFEIDEDAYATDAFFPETPVVISTPGFIRGRRVVFVQVFPLQFNPVTSELRGFATINFALGFAGGIDPAGAERKARLANPQSEGLAERLLLNFEPVQPGLRGLTTGLSTDDAADYLIIVADNLYEEILPLAEWKHRKGHMTRVMKMSEVGSAPADIRSFVQTAYDTWDPAPAFLLLVGDNEDVPADYYSGSLSCTSDIPYACVDGSDCYPDLTLGRLPVHTEAECLDVVDKILTYDRSPDPGDWYHNFLSAGYFQDYNDDNGVADRWFMETSITIYDFMISEQGWGGYTALCTSYWPLHYSTWHFRSDSYPHREDVNEIRWGVRPYPDPVPQWIVDMWTPASVATADITAAINAGVGIVQHRDHGGETSWGDPPYGISNIASLSNGVMTPVVFSVNCSTGSFQYSGGDCFCEAFLKKYPGGAVGLVGATRTSYSGHNDLLAHGLYTCFWPAYDTSHNDPSYAHSWRPADALNYAKYYMFLYEGGGGYTEGEIHMFHWFGDPDLALRTAAPQTLTVTHPDNAVYNVPIDVTVVVQESGVPVEDALVCISHPTAPDYWSGLTDVTGTITFSQITLTLQDNYDIVVTEHDAVPYEGTISGVLSSAGIITLDKELYSCADTVGVMVADLDLAGAGTQDMELTTDGGDSETLTLHETAPGSAIFEGTIETSEDPVNVDDGVLQVAHDQTITGTYYDVDDGTGNPAVVEDTAGVDCLGPTISDIAVYNISSDSATVSFNTTEAALGSVRYGLACDQLTESVSGTRYETEHTLVLPDLLDGATYFFVVDAEDKQGNLVTDDHNGECYNFSTPQVVYAFDMGTNPGWTTSGQWAYGQPSGGGSYNGDPTSGYTGPNVYGYNLAGDYANNLPATYLTTSVIDCAGLTDVSLRFRRWLGVESNSNYDEATVEISNDGSTWHVIWRATDTGAAVADTSWQLQEFDISDLADEQSTVYVRWGMGPTDAGTTYPGWNIDDVEIVANGGALGMSFPDGLPELLEPGEPTDITVRVVEGDEQYIQGSGKLHYRYNGGDYLTVTLVPLGGEFYQATLPPAHCDSAPEFYFSAEGSASGVIYRPPTAPSETFTAEVGVLTVALEDNFNTDQGWTVQNENLVDGPWERAIPAGGGDRGDPPSDYDGSGYCYVTDNVDGDSDVDGGPTRLLSPTLDLSQADEYTISYAR
ncbi:MAG: hypothetical protein KKB50_02860, partial [Planctomycetes bacterium]|nr:hypothetical protein [Planctomycetota bacterium]